MAQRTTNNHPRAVAVIVESWADVKPWMATAGTTRAGLIALQLNGQPVVVMSFDDAEKFGTALIELAREQREVFGNE